MLHSFLLGLWAQCWTDLTQIYLRKARTACFDQVVISEETASLCLTFDDTERWQRTLSLLIHHHILLEAAETQQWRVACMTGGCKRQFFQVTVIWKKNLSPTLKKTCLGFVRTHTGRVIKVATSSYPSLSSSKLQPVKLQMLHVLLFILDIKTPKQVGMHVFCRASIVQTEFAAILLQSLKTCGVASSH